MANDVVIKIRADGVERTEQQVSKLSGSIGHLGNRTGQASGSFLQATQNLLPFGSALNRTVNAAESAGKGLQSVAASAGTFPFILAGGTLAVLALAGAIGTAFAKTVSFSSSLQQNEIAFKTMTGSIDIARQHLADLKQFALETPFQFGDLVEYSRRLQAMGVETDDVVETLRTLGNVAAGVGMEKLPQLILAFGQVKAAGHLTGMELRQFTEAGVPLLRELAKAYGVTTSAMQEMISEGRVGFDSIRFVMEEMTEEGGRIGPQMQEQQRTFATATSNIKDSLLQLGDQGFKPLFTGITEAALAFSDFLQTDEAKTWASSVSANLATVGNTLSWLKDRYDDTRGARDLLFNISGSISQKMKELNEEQKEMASWPQWVDISNPAGQPLQGPPMPSLEDLAAGLESTKTARTLPPLLPGDVKKAGAAVKEVKDRIAEMLPVMEQLNRANAFKVWREEMKTLLASGDIEGVIAQFEAIGKNANETAQEILRMAEENQTAMDALTKKGLGQIEELRRKEADAAIEKANRIVQGTFAAIQSALGRGGTLEEGMAAFAEAEWIQGMAETIKAALAAGLTLDPDLIAAYQKAITNTMDIQRQQAKELEDDLRQIKKDSLAAQAKLDADYVAQWVKDLEYRGRQEYEASQQRLRNQIIEVEGIKFTLEGFRAWQQNLNRASERQARAERLDELSTEIGFQEFRLATQFGAVPRSQEARELREIIRLMRLQLEATEKGQTVDGQVLSGVASRRTGSDAVVWARVGGE